METVHGGMLYISSGAGVATKLGTAAKWSFAIDRDVAEAVAMGDTWVDTVGGALKWTGAIDGVVDTADANPFAVGTASALCLLYLYPVATTTARNYSGSCWPTLSVDCGNDGAAKFNMKVTGSGALAQN